MLGAPRGCIGSSDRAARSTPFASLEGLLVDLVEHPDDAALIEQIITVSERFFRPAG